MTISQIKQRIKAIDDGLAEFSAEEKKQFGEKLLQKKAELEADLNKLETAEAKIKKAEKTASSKSTPASKKTIARKQVAKAKQEKIKVVKKTAITSASVKDILAKYSKKAQEFNKGRSKEDLELDAKRQALPAGKRISADGNTYYEYRPNHADAGKRKLEEGGEIEGLNIVNLYSKDNNHKLRVFVTDEQLDVLEQAAKDTDKLIIDLDGIISAEPDATRLYIFLDNVLGSEVAKKYVQKLEMVEPYNAYAKGGNVYQNKPEGENYTRYEDSKDHHRANPAGWRFTNAGAKRLKLSNNKAQNKPTKEQIAKYKGKYFTDSKGEKHRYIYIERRADKSDLKRSFPFLERGGGVPNKPNINFNAFFDKFKKVANIGEPYKNMAGEKVSVVEADTIEVFNEIEQYLKEKNVPYIVNSINKKKLIMTVKNKPQFAKGGEITNNQEYEQYLRKYDTLGAKLEDVIEDKNEQEIERIKSEMEHIENEIHRYERSYKEGGEIDNIDVVEDYALKVYVKPTKKEGKALFKQGDAISVVYDDGEHEWVGENDILKMEEGEIEAEIAEELLQNENIDVFGYTTKNFDVSEHAAQYFLEAIGTIGENETAKESLAKAAEHLDSILHKVKVKEDGEFSEFEVKTLIADVQLFSYNNYKCGMPISIDLVSNICSEILELDVEKKEVFETGGEMYEKGGEVYTKIGSNEKLVFKADTKGGKNTIEIIEGNYSWGKSYNIEKYKNGVSVYSSSERDKDKLKKWINRTLEESKYIDNINYIISVDEINKQDGEVFESGGEIVESNNEMLQTQLKAVEHHAKELSSIITDKTPIEAWVVGKIERASTDLSDITHYLDWLKFEEGGEVINYLPVGKKVSNQDIDEFVNYVNEFYGKKGIYAKDLDGGFDKKEIKDAVSEYIKELGSQKTWGNGDSLDRERVRLYLENKIDKKAKGGSVSFKDKVKAISSRLEGTKVKPKYQKQYRRTYDKMESIEAATKIAGKQVAKSKMAKGGVIYHKSGNLKSLRDANGKLVKELTVKGVKYVYNPTYKTYNSEEGNKTLHKTDY